MKALADLITIEAWWPDHHMGAHVYDPHRVGWLRELNQAVRHAHLLDSVHDHTADLIRITTWYLEYAEAQEAV